MTISRRAIFAQMFLAALVQAYLSPDDASADTITYTYDAQGRVTRVVYSNGVTVDYTYDAAGNRSQVVRTGGLTPPPPPPVFDQTIQITGAGPVNLRTLANNAGYTGDRDAAVIFQLGAGVTIAGAVNGGVGIDTGAWPLGLFAINLTLQVSGKAYGGGGTGGKGAVFGNGAAGGAGGDALYCRLPMTVVVNVGGEVKAGGGGAGGGGGRTSTNPEFDRVGGGGGGGFPNGLGGAMGTPTFDGDSNGANNGAAGTTTGGGVGGSGETGGGGAGGAGGGAGAVGANGVVGSGSGTAKARGVGGAPGFAIRMNGNTVIVTNNGTIVGGQG